MANKDDRGAQLGAWAKRCYFAGRALMDGALRPYGLGATQWYVLHRLNANGPTPQRDLHRLLQVERATLSVMIRNLVGKGLVEQVADPGDQRQKRVQLTAEGASLWARLPDLQFINRAAFGHLEPRDVEAAITVLRAATERLENLSREDPQ